MWIGDKWHVSPYNFREDVLEGLNFPPEIIFSDCTMRDGEQQAGVVFTKEEKIKIARKLDELGIQEIEAGTPAVSEEDRQAMKTIVKEGLRANVRGVCRLLKKDIDMAVDCDLWGVLLSTPSGYLQLEYKLKWSGEELLSKAMEAIDYAKDHGLYVAVSSLDCTRSHLEFFRKWVTSIGVESRADRIRLTDTVGSASPEAIKFIIRTMKEISRKPVEVHCHNDFGLATANTIAALGEGTEVVSGTINGLGERAGNTPIEEVALALRLLYGIDTGLRYEKLYETSKLVEKLSRIKLQANKAVVGDNAFRHESGMVVSGIIVNPYTGEAYDPELVGQNRNIVLGKGSGRHIINYKLKQLGVEASDEEVFKILERVKIEGIKKKWFLTDKEFKNIVDEVVQST
ncbi:MAG: hypothetical protein GTN80_05895 [Nitrososphaeria archaeon]|nr:hypothetical protein [Nitrososphaeria archaeon]NIN52682.1 hypothetical protein [Nitrososphaeria archaeon]NIQ33157.1 hypothetical protein [Nitrososphaeria archaeon]